MIYNISGLIRRNANNTTQNMIKQYENNLQANEKGPVMKYHWVH